MTITYRSVKGSNLTATEVDANFEDLVAQIASVIADIPAPVNISNITVVGTQMTITLEDSTVFGPFTLPQANFRPAITEAVTGTTYELLAADANKYKRCTNASGCAVLISSGLAMVVDSEIYFRQVGAGPVTIDGDTDVIINIPDGLLAQSAVRHGGMVLKCVGTDEYDLEGRLAEDVTA